jgi:hypothetical protein
MMNGIMEKNNFGCGPKTVINATFADYGIVGHIYRKGLTSRNHKVLE